MIHKPDIVVHVETILVTEPFHVLIRGDTVLNVLVMPTTKDGVVDLKRKWKTS